MQLKTADDGCPRHSFMKAEEANRRTILTFAETDRQKGRRPDETLERMREHRLRGKNQLAKGQRYEIHVSVSVSCISVLLYFMTRKRREKNENDVSRRRRRR